MTAKIIYPKVPHWVGAPLEQRMAAEAAAPAARAAAALRSLAAAAEALRNSAFTPDSA